MNEKLNFFKKKIGILTSSNEQHNYFSQQSYLTNDSK